jgi:hypothetical protein
MAEQRGWTVERVCSDRMSAAARQPQDTPPSAENLWMLSGRDAPKLYPCYIPFVCDVVLLLLRPCS